MEIGSVVVIHKMYKTRILQRIPLGVLLVLQAVKGSINNTAWSCICYFRRGFLCLFYVRV